MSIFMNLVKKCGENLERRKVNPDMVQMIVLSKEDEEEIVDLEYKVRKLLMTIERFTKSCK